MNVASSNFPRLDGAACLPRPGFDILVAVSIARQATLPTVRMLRDRGVRESHEARVNELCRVLSGSATIRRRTAGFPARFFDLSEEVNSLPETVNKAFTRAFQPMLSPYPLHHHSSAQPTPHDDELME